MIGSSENGEVDLPSCDLRGPTLLVIGNETSGMSAAWARHCDQIVRIPMLGTASSLNAAVSASIVLYEAMRQRLGPASGSTQTAKCLAPQADVS